MIDPEVARLRRLRDEALRIREIARALEAAPWAKSDQLLARGACASWRIARLASGKLVAHPYLRYQKSAGVGTLVGNRLLATYLALLCKERVQGLKLYESRLHGLARQLDDARALTWSTEFSDSLGRSQAEIKSLLQLIATETQSAPAPARLPVRAAGANGLVGELAQGIEGDWPYLAL